MTFPVTDGDTSNIAHLVRLYYTDMSRSGIPDIFIDSLVLQFQGFLLDAMRLEVQARMDEERIHLSETIDRLQHELILAGNKT